MSKTETTPIYKRLIDDYKKLIDEGRYRPGDLLPSENELAKSYSTTRITVRQALSVLINMGYITRRHGKGSIVLEPKKGLGILSLKGVTTGVGDHKLRTEIIEKPNKGVWPEDFFYELNPIEQKAGCLFFSRLRYINNEPILFEETYITNIGLPRFTSRNLENQSLFETLQKYYSVEVEQGEQKIWAIQADERICQLLELHSNSPVVHMKRKIKTNVKEVYIYSSLYCNTTDFYLQDYF